MGYDDVKQELGHEPVFIAELEIDFCANDFGVSPCTAVGGAGTECYNTYANCRDKANFVKETRKYRFATDRVAAAMQEAGEPPVFPTLISVDMTPTKLEPGRGLGIRSTCNVELMDHPWTDVGIDPYFRTRSYDPDEQGSFWGKWLSRNPYYENRRLNIYAGYLEEDGTFNIGNFIKRTYLLFKIDGPGPMGNVSIQAKDPLKKSDADRAQIPPVATATLDGDITDSTSTFNIIDPDGQLIDWIDNGITGSDPQSYIRIDDEIMRVTSHTATSLTVVRSPNTTAMPSWYESNTNIETSHQDGASIQQTYVFDEVRIDNLIKFLLVEVSEIPTEFVDYDNEWSDTIADAGYTTYLMSALLTETKAVKDLLNELTELNVYIWWDERGANPQVRLGVLSFQSVLENALNEDDNILSDSIDVSRNVRKRLSQVWLGHGHRNPTYKLDQDVFFSTWQISADLGAESEWEFQYNDRRLRKIRSRWLTRTQTSVANEISNRTLIDDSDTKIKINMSLDAKDDNYWTGDYLAVETRLIQNDDGSNRRLNYLILEAQETLNQQGTGYNYIIEGRPTFSRTGVITHDEIGGPQNLVWDTNQLLYNGDTLQYEAVPVQDWPDYEDAKALSPDPEYGDLLLGWAYISYDDTSTPTITPPGFLDGTTAYQISV